MMLCLVEKSTIQTINDLLINLVETKIDQKTVSLFN